jgi:hypothetical protein
MIVAIQGISRNTVRLYLRSEITEPSYAERRASSALDKYSLQLSGWLKAETVKPRKQRRNLKQIHEDLKELGYEGSYDRVAAFARQWKAGQSDRVNSASKRTVTVTRSKVVLNVLKRQFLLHGPCHWASTSAGILPIGYLCSGRKKELRANARNSLIY